MSENRDFPVYILYRNTHVRYNLGKEKLLIFGIYNPTSINNRSFLNYLYNAITFYSTLYKNCVLLDDLNIARDNTQLQNFFF